MLAERVERLLRFVMFELVMLPAALAPQPVAGAGKVNGAPQLLHRLTRDTSDVLPAFGGPRRTNVGVDALRFGLWKK